MIKYKEIKSSNLAGKNLLTKTNLRVITTLVMLTVFFVTGASQVQAEDGKIYPGSMGVRYAGTSTPSFSYSAIGNPSSSSWLYLDLPIVNDGETGINRGWVRAIDMNESKNGNIQCSLYSVYRSGSSWYGWSTPRKSSSGNEKWAQILTFNSIKGNGFSHYYYSCAIPPKYYGNTSYIESYRVNER